jgi:hypothetical protein
MINVSDVVANVTAGTNLYLTLLWMIAATAGGRLMAMNEGRNG